MSDLPIVTNENYFDPEISMAYMGSTQYKDFCQCESRALAIATGKYRGPSSTALLVGGYVDAYFSSELPLFKAQHPELFKRDGSLKSEYVHANDVIARMEEDELYMLLMSGRHQVVKTGTIAGVPFKIKIDSLIDADTCRKIAEKFPDAASALGMLDGAIVDQKCMKDFTPVWSEEDRTKLPFVEAWGYDIQGAIYQAVEGHMLPFIIAAGTKESTPDLAALSVPDDVLREKLYEVEDKAPRFQAIKEGKIKPESCGHCEWCKMRRKLTGIADYRDLV